MTKQDELLAMFKAARVVPVLTIDRVEDAVPLARALVKGGVGTVNRGQDLHALPLPLGVLRDVEEVGRLAGHTNYVYSLAFTPDGATLVSGSGDSTVRVWDTIPLAQRRAAR